MTTTKTKVRAAAKIVATLSARERAAIGTFRARRAAKSSARIVVSKTGEVPKIAPDHPHDAIGKLLLMDALGTTDEDFLNGILGQLIDAGSQSREIDEPKVNFMLSIIKGIEPRNQLEAMLAAQMAAVHIATMTFARRLAHVENIPQQDSAERAFNKLTRTFTTQMEALKRYRTGGEQKVTVQHVSISEGGQAIVGNVTQTPREEDTSDKTAASPLALTDAKATAMPPIEESNRRGESRERNDGRS